MMKNRIKDSTKRYILIITALLLFTQIIRIYNFWVKLVSGDEFTFNVILSGRNEKCDFKLNNWPFSLENCHKYQSGSELKLVGRLTSSSDSQVFKTKKLNVKVISYEKNLISSGLSWIDDCMGTIEVHRSKVVVMLMGYMPAAPLALIIDMPFGQVIDLPEQVHQQLKTIGMLHVVAASGYNVSLIASLLTFLTARFKPPQAFFIWTLGMMLYLFLSDFSVSILRAFLMFTLKVLAVSFGRIYHNFILLTTAVFMFLLFEPWLILNLSFQLSVGATLGLMLFGDFFTKFFTKLIFAINLRHGFFNNYLVEPLSTAMAAQTITTLILLWHFGEVSAFSFLANVFLLWMTPFLTMGGLLLFSLGTASLMIPFFSNVVSLYSIYIWFYAQLFISLADFLSRTFLFQVKLQSSSLLIFLLIFLIIFLIIFKKVQSEKKNPYSLDQFATV